MISIEDLILQKVEKGDFYLHNLLVTNESVMKTISGRPLSEEESQAKFERILFANHHHPAFGYFKILSRKDRLFVGVAKLELEFPDSVEAELGYLLLPRYWGQGIAGTVARELVRVAMEEKQLKRLFAIIDPENIASKKILLKNNFSSVEFRDFDGLPGEIFELILEPAKERAGDNTRRL